MLNLLPIYPRFKGKERRAQNSVSVMILDQFLDRFQSLRSAVNLLGISASEFEERARLSKICPAPEADGLLVYLADDLLNL